MSSKDIAQQAKTISYKVAKACSEQVTHVAEEVARAGLYVAGVAGMTKKASIAIQDLLSQAGSLIEKHRRGDGSFKDTMPIEGLLEIRDDLYNDVLEKSRNIGKAKYDSEVRQARGNKKLLPTKNKNTYGKDARKNISNKLKAFRNFFWCLSHPEFYEEALAVVRDAGTKDGNTWTQCAKIFLKVQLDAVANCNRKVMVGVPVNDPAGIWFIRTDQIKDLAPWTDDQGRKIASITWGSGDNAYTTDVILTGNMTVKKLYTLLEARELELARASSKARSDLNALIEVAVPPEQVLTPRTADSDQ